MLSSHIYSFSASTHSCLISIVLLFTPMFIGSPPFFSCIFKQTPSRGSTCFNASPNLITFFKTWSLCRLSFGTTHFKIMLYHRSKNSTLSLSPAILLAAAYFSAPTRSHIWLAHLIRARILKLHMLCRASSIQKPAILLLNYSLARYSRRTIDHSSPVFLRTIGHHA